MKVTISGYKPRIWQSDVHNALKNAKPSEVFTVKAPRQRGKSYMLQYELINRALSNKNSCSIYLAPTQGQSRKMFKSISKMLFSLVKTANNTLLEITFNNGSEILFRSAEQKDNLRGYTIKNGGILIIDEAAYIQDEIYDIILPTTNVFKANTILVSTPRFTSGRFYEYFLNGTLNKEGYQSFDWCNYDTSEFLSDTQKEIYRLSYNREKFITEIEGQFISNDGSLFIGIESCIKEPSDNNIYYMAIDWGSGLSKDNTAITILNNDKDLVFIKYFNNKTPSQQIDEIVDIINTYKPIKITVESNSIGNIYFDLLQKRVSKRIDKFYTDNKNKNNIIARLQSAIEHNEIGLLRDDELLLELRAYRAELTKSGLITYNAPSGFKDDLVMSLAICYSSMVSNKGNYNIKLWNGKT